MLLNDSSNSNSSTYKSWNKKMIILGLAITIIVSIISYFQSQENDKLNAQFEKEGVYTTGTILGYTRKNKIGVIYYKFEVHEKIYNGELQKDARYTSTEDKKLYKNGLPCKILYIKSNPSINRLILE